LSYLLITVLAVMDTFLGGYKEKEIIKLFITKIVRLYEAEEWYVKILSNMSFGFTNIDDNENENVGCGQHEAE